MNFFITYKLNISFVFLLYTFWIEEEALILFECLCQYFMKNGKFKIWIYIVIYLTSIQVSSSICYTCLLFLKYEIQVINLVFIIMVLNLQNRLCKKTEIWLITAFDALLPHFTLCPLLLLYFTSFSIVWILEEFFLFQQI